MPPPIKHNPFYNFLPSLKFIYEHSFQLFLLVKKIKFLNSPRHKTLLLYKFFFSCGINFKSLSNSIQDFKKKFLFSLHSEPTDFISFLKLYYMFLEVVLTISIIFEISCDLCTYNMLRII